MAIVVPGKFIYLATLGTASSATTTALRGVPGAFQPKDPRTNLGKHATLAQVRRACGDQLTGTEYVFAAVRNPYDLLVSWYLRQRKHFQVPRDATFLEFLRAWVSFAEEPYMRDQKMFYVAADAKHVMRYERGTEAELNNVLRKIPMVPEVRLTLENVTLDKQHWSLYYDSQTYAFVNSTFASDISRYGYCFVHG